MNRGKRKKQGSDEIDCIADTGQVNSVAYQRTSGGLIRACSSVVLSQASKQ